MQVRVLPVVWPLIEEYQIERRRRKLKKCFDSCSCETGVDAFIDRIESIMYLESLRTIGNPMSVHIVSDFALEIDVYEYLITNGAGPGAPGLVFKPGSWG